MARTEGADELFDIKAHYYTGNYQACIDEASKLRLTGEKATERDCFLFRSYIAQNKFRVVLDAVKPSADAALKAVRLFAEYMAGNEQKRKQLLPSFDQQLETDASNDIVMLMAASAYYMEGDCENALKYLHQSNDLECLNLSVKILLAINRADLAGKKTEEDVRY